VKAVVLLGGEGTRLRPLTFSTPKPMLPVAGRPVIERVLDHLSANGVDEVVLSLCYRPDAFVQAFPDGRYGDVRLHYAVEASPLATAGAIAFAAAEAALGGETFLVVNGDVLTEIDLSALVDFHRSQGAEGTVALVPIEDPSQFGVVPVDAEGRVTAFIEKPQPGKAPTNMVNTGIYVLEPSFLERVPKGRRVSVEREVFPSMAAAGSLYALGSEALWTDMGTPLKYLEANLAWARREGAAHASRDAGVVDSVVDHTAVIGPGCVVHEAVVLHGARLKPGATVKRSIIGPGVVVGSGAVVEGLSVLGQGWEVADGEALDGARLPAG